MLYRFRHKIVGPLVIAWLLLTVASVFSRLMVWNHLAESLRSTEEATLLGDDLNDLYATLQSAESSQRGYLLTGNESYLKPLNQAESALSPSFSRMADLAMRDRMLQNDLLRLRGLCSLKMTEMKETIKVRQEEGVSAAAAAVDSGKGQDLMEQIRKVITHMRAQGHSLFSEAGLATRRQLQAGQNLTMLAGVLGVGAGLIALYLVRVGYLQDKAQRELLEDKIRAEKTVSEKSAFLANMSHEIRTPMNAILGFGELLEGESLTAKQAQYVRSIRQSGSSLLQLINDVLDLSKFEAGRLELNLEPTDVREISGFLQTMFAQQAAAKSLELKFDVGSAPQALLLDRLRLRQVLVNLIGNAIKFTRLGFVETRVKWLYETEDRSRGTLLIEVEDSGAGISPEKQKAIFEPFVQAEPCGTTENQGAGLGLNIVQRLMEMMKGTVSLESAFGKGSIFRLRFPDVSISARLPLSDLAEANEAVNFDDFEPTTFLAVDDNETNRNLIIGMFEKTRHKVRVARDGREALQSIAEVKPGLVLLDVRMPVMDGRETLNEIRKNPDLQLLPVIAVTASSQENDEENLRNRFNGYLRKPFSQQMLYKELAQFLRRNSQANSAPNDTGEISEPVTVATAKRAVDWEVLLAELRILHAGEWAALQESLAINDTQAFARKLRLLAAHTQCAPLAAYAETLAAHAEAYAVRDLEEHLAAFPALVQTVEQQTMATRG
jgi:signal transduction histidine kinase/CheY-like chemotaxis protein